MIVIRRIRQSNSNWMKQNKPDYRRKWKRNAQQRTKTHDTDRKEESSFSRDQNLSRKLEA